MKKRILFVIQFFSYWTTIAPFFRTFYKSYIPIYSIIPKNGDIAIRFGVDCTSVTRKQWDSLMPVDVNAFASYDWITCLENSGCASTKEGWQPCQILLYSAPNELSKVNDMPSTSLEENSDSIIYAMILLYVKYHSYGEFIFDQSWADYAQYSLGVNYYPKMLSAIPFTPATGPRILINQNISTEHYENLLNISAILLKEITKEKKLSSIHLNFIENQQVSSFLSHDYDLRETIQFRWRNHNSLTNQPYQDFDDYLTQFQSKRRTQIKSERRKVYQEDILIKVIHGDDIEADDKFYHEMFLLYTTTIEKMWGTQYLSAEFFQLLSQTPSTFRKQLVFIVAYDTATSKLIAATINMKSKTHFYGRYWGCHQFIKHLHFELCYYKTIEYCIKHRIEYMEPGAGGGEFKFLRGFNPYIVNSLHWFQNPALKGAIQRFLLDERNQNQETKEYLLKNSKLKGPVTGLNPSN